MLFLGAGSSTPMNIDDLSGLTSKVKESVSSGLASKIEQLDQIFKENKEIPRNFKVDIEVLLHIFNCLANKHLMLNEIGPFALLMHHFARDISKFKDLEVSSEDLYSFKESVRVIIEQRIGGYGHNNEQKLRARHLYDQIFQIPIRNDHRFPNAQGGDAAPVFNFAATVNYDLILEIYSRQTDIPTVPHFYESRGFISDSGVFFLGIEGIREGRIQPNYIKLHGSIDWWINDQQKIVASFERNNPLEVLTDRSIIYPIYEKSVTADPFFTLYQSFRNRLFMEDIVIIIGYSFRDISINNAFLDWLTAKRESRLLIVARKENQPIITNILANNTRIQFINTYFGENDFITELENTLRYPAALVR